ncbi:MAG: 1-deoxy-D-xylulose-5-phosphate reductoisomerase [Firmicutes bacterium]|nr:1-deoxy-D-xylulose-5-phosphate reductoisomerase [Bacillota bacterium]
MAIKITLLGSTGSIGRQTLEVVDEFPELFKVEALAAGSNIRLLAEQARKYRPSYLVIDSAHRIAKLQELLSGIKPTVLTGIEGMKEVAALPEVDLVLTAVVGAVGIEPTLAAINAGKRVALANKETLVAAGSIIMPAALRNNVKIIPVDSEHSAIFQCLQGVSPGDVERLVLTASGGPFRGYRPEDLEKVTLEQALNHPNWDMGGKITIDSATMFNKGLEIIEAHWLFGLEFDRIDVVIHPESIIHSLVVLADGSHLAQMGLCDMRLPIQYALTYPKHLPNSFPKLDLLKGAQLNFQPVDSKLFPAIELAYQAGRFGGSLPAALNAANEEAVKTFLKGKIRFVDIIRVVSEVVARYHRESFAAAPDLEEILAVDSWARLQANEIIEQGRKFLGGI